MVDQSRIEDNPWFKIDRFLRQKLGLLQIGANLAGACIVTAYFVFLDQIRPIEKVNNTVTVVLIMFVGLVIIAIVFLHR